MKELLIKQQKCAFVAISVEAIDDDRLDLRDLGLLNKLLRLPDNWHFTIKGLTKIIKNDGEYAIKKTLQNLEKYGYLVRQKLQDESGKFCGQNWLVRDYVPEKENGNLKPFSPGGEFYTRGENGSVTQKNDEAVHGNGFAKPFLPGVQNSTGGELRTNIKYNINKKINNKNIYLSDEKISSNTNLFFNKMTSSKLTAQKPSTFDEVCAYFARAGLKTNPERFYAYYQSTNWEGIKNWKIAARRWVDYPPKPANPIGRSFKTSSYKPLNSASAGFAKPHMADLSYGTSYNNYENVLPDVSTYY